MKHRPASRVRPRPECRFDSRVRVCTKGVPQTLNPKPSTQNPDPPTLNPDPPTLNPEQNTGQPGGSDRVENAESHTVLRKATRVSNGVCVCDRLRVGRGAARAADAQGTPTQSQPVSRLISPAPRFEASLAGQTASRMQRPQIQNSIVHICSNFRRFGHDPPEMPAWSPQSNLETLVIYGISARTFVKQNDLYQ